MGGAVSAGEDNDELIDNLVEAEYIKTPHVERIFRAVDRGDYYLEGCKENAYRDLAWKHGNIHLSAPCIYSEVMESLKLEPGMSFLNLGSGTGYLSTMAGLVLGAYGTNHGVELHADVVEYAQVKLDEFQSSSPALDKYEFCTPSFVVGNCLLLDSSSHQYDRVYCGASCPSEHENYMKNLVRVGGILVMPLNDHLLQVTRTGEMTYDVKNVLPVSFASLVLPQPSETHAFIKLPEKHPLPLQEICRSAIRILLRINAEAENPSLKDKKKLVPTKRKRAKRRVRKVIIPVFDHQAAPERPHSSDVESIGDDPNEVRSMLEDLPPEEQEELRRLEQDCLRDQEHFMPLTSQEGKLENRLDNDSPENEQLKELDQDTPENEQLKELDQDITCNNGKKRFINDNLRTLMENDGLCPLVEDKSQKTSNDNGKRILNDDNGRLLDVDSSEACSSKKASSIDGMARTSSNNNSRRGSKSDSENSRRGSQAEASDSGRSSQGDSFNYRHWLAQRKKEVLEETNLLMSLEYIRERNTEPEAMDTTDTEVVNSETANEQRNSQPKVRGNRSDSQKILNGDSGIDNISDDSVSGESSSDPEKTEAEAESKPLTSKVSNEDALEACLAVRHASYLKRSAEDNEDELYLPTSLAAARQAGRCCQKAVIFKRIAYSDVDSDDLDDLESDSGKESFPKDLEGTREKSDLSCYTYYMTQKINMLPLPHPLKIFLNYSRPV